MLLHPVWHSCCSFVLHAHPEVHLCCFLPLPPLALCREGVEARSMHTEREGCCCLVHTHCVCWRGTQELPAAPRHADTLCWVRCLCSWWHFIPLPVLARPFPPGCGTCRGMERHEGADWEALSGRLQGLPCGPLLCGCLHTDMCVVAPVACYPIPMGGRLCSQHSSSSFRGGGAAAGGGRRVVIALIAPHTCTAGNTVCYRITCVASTCCVPNVCLAGLFAVTRILLCARRRQLPTDRVVSGL